MRQPASVGARRAEPGALEPALRRLAALAPLSSQEQELVRSLGAHLEMHAAGSELVAPDAVLPKALLVVSGWACRQRVLPDGRRQIFGFLAPGDAIGLSADPGPLARSATVALTRMVAAPAQALRAAAADAAQAWPGLAFALRAGERQDERRLLDHVTRLGRQSAYERVAHMLLELHQRMAMAGLAQGRGFSMPLTQETLADALGLSIVHVNRVLQQLRRERLIEMHGGRVVLLQPESLAGIADFALAAA